MKKELRQKIRSEYKQIMPYIKEVYPRFSPYDLLDLDIISIMTPIERNVWQDIRVLNCNIKCPQFPIKGYFVDFADPIKKIAIEVDGKEWHQDKLKDKKRQKEIESLGWTVYRIPGWKTFKEVVNKDEYLDICDQFEEPEAIKSKVERINRDCSENIIKNIMLTEYSSDEYPKVGLIMNCNN